MTTTATFTSYDGATLAYHRNGNGDFANGQSVVVPGRGHYPWLDRPQPFVATIADFLAT